MANLIASADANDGLLAHQRKGLTRVRVLWYDDGSMRIRAYTDGPMGITEAYLQGDKHSIVRIAPVKERG